MYSPGHSILGVELVNIIIITANIYTVFVIYQAIFYHASFDLLSNPAIGSYYYHSYFRSE